jgi:hypothetical protein
MMIIWLGRWTVGGRYNDRRMVFSSGSCWIDLVLWPRCAKWRKMKNEKWTKKAQSTTVVKVRAVEGCDVLTREEVKIKLYHMD